MEREKCQKEAKKRAYLPFGKALSAHFWNKEFKV